MKYKHSILGGTFDHLHIGHKHFIKTAFKSSERLTIGLTTEALHKDKLFPHSILSYDIREEELRSFLKNEGLLSRAKIIPIKDIYGNSLTEKDIDAIFVTRHGYPSAQEINRKRLGNHFPKLKIEKVSFVRGEDGNIVSSTRIREGVIDRNGKSYKKLFDRNLSLPNSLRAEVINTPSGKLVKDYKSILGKNIIVAVGDVVSSDLLKLGRQADISIVDKKTKRSKNNDFLKAPDIIVRNNNGTIKKTASEAILRCFKSSSKKVIRVLGEEDLLALPATLLAPLGSVVLYGMPDKGVVVVEVTEGIKEQVMTFVENLEK
ncbi:MAG TPA: pantetheine-phosphate adenylyltransferase [Patescibacteria group bacterium]|nr:pantetheine-phosphate adenylyltransferase [Patescibacteria group bacterium]